MVEIVSKEGSHNDLYTTYQTSIVELFNTAESHDTAQFFLSFLSLRPLPWKFAIPVGGMAYDVPDMEIEEAFETHRYLEDAVADEQLPNRLKTRLMLIVSFHFLEADRWHSILGNVLNVIIGRNYVANLFEGDPLGQKIDGIRGLLKECEKRRIVLSIGDVYSNICNDNIRELRNAFLHCHYTLSPQGDLLITKGLMQRQPGAKKYFKFDEIQDIHRRIVTFLTVFALAIKERRRKFEDRQIDLHHQIDWIETAHKPKPTVKRCETRYILKGRLSYGQDDKKWHLKGRFTNIGQN